MNKPEECKIIRELLPNYIDNILDKEVKDYVEEHLKQCKECSEVLESMNAKEEKEYENTKEIDYLKKIKRKILNITMIVVILAIALLGGTLYYQKTMKEINSTWKYTNIILKNKDDFGSKIERTYIYTFNKKNECIDTRILIENLDQRAKEDLYNGLIRSYGDVCNITKYENRILANISIYNGMTKAEIIKWANNNNYQVIEM